jgi:hypothetical protein
MDIAEYRDAVEYASPNRGDLSKPLESKARRIIGPTPVALGDVAFRRRDTVDDAIVRYKVSTAESKILQGNSPAYELVPASECRPLNRSDKPAKFCWVVVVDEHSSVISHSQGVDDNVERGSRFRIVRMDDTRVVERSLSVAGMNGFLR